MHNKLLLQQIKKYLGTETPPAEYQTLFKAISETYTNYEKEKEKTIAAASIALNAMRARGQHLQRELLSSKNSYQQLKIMLENVDDVFFTVDMVKKETINMSAACEKIYGYRAIDFMANKNLWQEVIPEEDRTRIQKSYLRMYKGRRFSHEHRIITKSGEVKWVETKITPTLNKDGKLVRIDGITIDITQYKKTELGLMNAEANLRNVFENTDMAYLLLDKQANVLSFNHVAKEMLLSQLGVTINEGLSYFDLFPQKSHAIVKQKLDDIMQKKQRIGYETKYINIKGVENWVALSMHPIINKDQEFLGLSVAAKNITKRKQLELERIKITNDLIQRNKDLEQFTYIISHNLRSPVANILGLSVLIRNPKTSRKIKSDCMKGLEISVKRLDTIVTDLNHILQVRRGISEKKETARFSNMVYNITDSIKYLVEKEEVKINTNFSNVDEIYTIKSYLYSIFYNLISNSIKYRKAEEPPVIEISSTKEDKKTILVFKDNCMGIDLKQHKDKVFGLYKRFHPNIEGKGMGLYMVKTQVESLGGRIDIRSEVNKGTEILLEFES